MTATIVETYVWDGIAVRIFSDSCPKFWWSVWPDCDPRDHPCRAGIFERWDPAPSLEAARRGAQRRVRHEPKRRTPVRTFGFLFFSLAVCCVGTAVNGTFLANSADLEMVDHALTGWKRAALSFGSGKPVLRGAMGTTYGATALARCTRRGGYFSEDPCAHSPNRDCTCGFYAARDRAMLPQLAGEYGSTVCDLEVELSGHYLQYKRGFRAERQQVVSVRVDPTCRLCGTYPLDAEVLVAAGGLLVPMCEQCAKGVVPRHTFTLAELAAELGVHDVRWADRPALQKGN